MKKLLKKIITRALMFEASLALGKYKPRIVGVTGTVGKTSAKDAIAAVLKSKYSVRASEKSYNTDIGLPLTILGERNQWNNPLGWLRVIFCGLLLVLFRREYPEILVLEFGVDAPGDMDRLVRRISGGLNVAVVTSLGETPVHVEAFGSAERLHDEKLKIVQAIRHGGTLVLNYDDGILAARRNSLERKGIEIITYGFDENSNMRASDYALLIKNGEPDGVAFKVKHGGDMVPVRMHGVLGAASVSAALAALTVGDMFGVNIVSGSSLLRDRGTGRGRLRWLDGIRGSHILDDSYNSSPVAVRAALDVLRDVPATRRVAVLGDMLELGAYSADEHKKIGRAARGVADVLVVVGSEARFIADEAIAVGFDTKRVFRFKNVAESIPVVANSIESGDVVLVKGSQSIRLEKLVASLLRDSSQEKNLLVRQDEEWQRR